MEMRFGAERHCNARSHDTIILIIPVYAETINFVPTQIGIMDWPRYPLIILPLSIYPTCSRIEMNAYEFFTRCTREGTSLWHILNI